MKEPQIVSSHNLKQGFTMVELIVVLVVLSILVAAVLGASYSYQMIARDRERANDIDTISRSLEQYYRTQSVATGATYPSSSTTAASIADIIGDTEVVAAPDEPGNSITIASVDGAQTPTVSEYSYQALQVDGSLCATSPCPRYKLFYRLEETNEVLTKNSMRQQ